MQLIKINKLSKVASLVALLCVGGCATNQLPQATIHASKTTDISDYKYLIGPGDSLNIFVWRNPEISGTFVVRPDGKITTSLVEDIDVSGKTPTELARNVEQILATYIKDPIVTVSVGGFVGPYSEQVRVIGQAASPQAINYRENMTLLDLMVQVGGLTQFADGDSAKLVRVVSGQQQTYNIRIDSLINDGDISANVDLLPGDIVIIPEAWF
ncbi:polysaccharide biosynthesis/export protein [Catenovulum agarivorans DS-2]|uniref:Polysaccharide biosynthesis/export protein n=1 Tax=Catenovulum agarivorans DS-2 TaxID=1328313 RepID=W7QE36_9ALTE|nr:XrtA/PEP-CTERM system exopolysaccharide export protein [Catenovulum agarivorans]EWH11159.1 polysaccharide biosynthesis/export protein [Catenovulum agarivorans DS-2]